MNWNHIATAYPEVYRLINSDDADLFAFFDSHRLVVVPTYEPEHAQPWGYELHGPERFVREQCRYTERQAAQEAGLLQACNELHRLINAGNE